MSSQDKNWTLPNILTVFRILMTPAFVVAFASGRYLLAWAIFVMAGVSDGLDGFLARVLKQRSHLGAILDPLADKFLLVTAFITLGLVEWLPSWLVILVVSRDLIIVGGLLLLKFLSVDVQNRIKPIWISKTNTLAQLFLIFIVMFVRARGWETHGFVDFWILVVAALTIMSGLRYVYKGLTLFPSSD